jgi:hypothetical protein
MADQPELEGAAEAAPPRPSASAAAAVSELRGHLDQILKKLGRQQLNAAYKGLLAADSRLLDLLTGDLAAKPGLAADVLLHRSIVALGRTKVLAEAGLPARARGEIRKKSRTVRKLAQDLLDLTGPRSPSFVFDPREQILQARIIALAMLSRQPHPLSEPLEEFGSGVYALFYTGRLACYAPVSGKRVPLYVGSAKYRSMEDGDEADSRSSLSGRLRDHLRSIRHVENAADGNLKVSEIEYRCLFVAGGYEVAAEDFLISSFRPVWNKESGVCEGIGKHGDKSETRSNQRSLWDTLHPGRPWAATPETTSNDLGPDEITANILSHFGKFPPHEIDLEKILGG